MSAVTPLELVSQIGGGLLSFPVTQFTWDRLEFDESAYREHLSWLIGFPVAGLFAAGGTGEFFSLSPAEVDRVVRVAVEEVNDRVPVLAPAGMGTVIAVEQARRAEAAGAAGILLFPPYLTETAPEGLVAHIRAVCEATGLGVVVYNRANARISVSMLTELADTLPNLVGFKDGIGDIELMTKIYTRFGDRFTYIGGLPTAEMFALPYLELGVTTYSSAIFNFIPDFAIRFYDDVRARRQDAVYDKLRGFVLPYLDIRDKEKGYAVAIIKAGVDAVGRRGGSVRPPLKNLTVDERAKLASLIGSLDEAVLTAP